MNRTALWSVGGALVAFYAVGIAQGWYLPMAAVGALVILATPLIGIAWARATRARADEVFLETYGSLDGAKAVLDVDALRAMRDAEGVISAVRHVRHRHPAIPLAQAAEIVRGL